MSLNNVQNGTVIPFSFKRLTPKNSFHQPTRTNKSLKSNTMKQYDEDGLISYNHKSLKTNKTGSSSSKICSLQDITNTTINFGNISLKRNNSNDSRKKFSNNSMGKNFMVYKDIIVLVQNLVY